MSEAELRELLAKATIDEPTCVRGTDVPLVRIEFPEGDYEAAEAFVAAVNALPSLLDELSALRARVAEVERERDENEGAFKVWRRRYEAAESRLLPPTLSEEQREKLAAALCDASLGKGFWRHYGKPSRLPWYGTVDRFHAILTRIGESRE